jgi:uncharacterized membrane protein
MFTQSLLSLWYGFINFVPSLLGAIILFIVGWIVARVIGKAIAQVIAAIKLDKLFESAGMQKFMDRAGLKITVGGFIGGIIKWFIIIVFLMASLQIVGLTQVNDFLSGAVLFYLPKVIIAALVLIIAAFIADAMEKVVSASAKAASVGQANMLGSVTRYAIWAFAFIIALSELGIASQFMQILFTGLIVAIALALGLSFGLGGKEAAARAIEKVSKEISNK